ncbi:MAG: phosphate/phosphite/phosphonate ABC transporter substrate-binding protein, partial [Chloroflexi bacterium]|nr:phosphate/phosphite/phosphonate ABC transporter substrate-binding protein [Chloroflexota bacterium]
TNSSDDNTLLTGVSGEEYAIGFFGYAYYAANQGSLKVVQIENADGECVEPSDETVQSGEYNPLSRPLFIYANNESVRTKDQVAAYLEYYFSEEGQAVVPEVGYSLPPEGTFEANQAALEAILAGEDPGSSTGGDAAADSTFGTAENPIVFAFVPSGDSDEIIASADELAEVLEEETGLVINAEVPTSYVGAREALCDGEAQVTALNTFNAIVAAEQGCGEVALVAERFGNPFYKGQIIVRADSGYESVEDLSDATFCRPDPTSTSGWIIPSITLRAAGVDVDALEVVDAGGHDGVVRAVYNGECDAGATFVDARGNVEEEFADVMDAVIVLTESVEIPNDGVQFSPLLPDDIRQTLVDAMVALSEQEGDVLEEIYEWDTLIALGDEFYDPFRQVLDASGVDIDDFIEE